MLMYTIYNHETWITLMDIFNKYNVILKSGKINNNIKKLVNNNVELKEWIWNQTQFISNLDVGSSRERIFCILNNIHTAQTCATCRKIVKFQNGYYPMYCSNKCSGQSSLTRQKTIITNLSKYGTHSPLESKEIQEKAKQTNLKRYGVEWTGQSIDKRIKTKQTIIERYGAEHQWCNNDIRDKITQTNIERYGTKFPIQFPDIQEKIKQTNLDRYGVEHISQSPDIREKIKQTNLDRYGVEFPLSNTTIKEKTKQSCFEYHGVKYPGLSKHIQEKIKQTNLERYGVGNPFTASDIKQKIKQTNLHKYGVSHYNQQHLIDILPLLQDYYWLFDQYVVQSKSATQIAKELGNVYYGTILNYLRAMEIEIKQYYFYSCAAINWLESIMEQEGSFIQHAGNIGEYQIPNTRYRADGYCKETNTVYEFHGDYWHGNPIVYAPDVINESTRCTMGELYQKTISKEQRLLEMGYNLIIKWETD